MLDSHTIQAFTRGHNQLNVTQQSRVFLASASTWDPALGTIFSTLAAGAVLCLCPRPEVVQTLGECLRDTRATHVFATPTLWSLNTLSPDELPHLAVVALGGERLPITMVDRWAESVDVINVYGVTEACVWQVAGRCTKGCDTSVVGLPHEGTQLWIEPIEGFNNGCGELWIGGDQLGLGYLNQPELTANHFISAQRPDTPCMRWFRTGDLATWQEDGRLKVMPLVGL